MTCKKLATLAGGCFATAALAIAGPTGNQAPADSGVAPSPQATQSNSPFSMGDANATNNIDKSRVARSGAATTQRGQGGANDDCETAFDLGVISAPTTVNYNTLDNALALDPDYGGPPSCAVLGGANHSQDEFYLFEAASIGLAFDTCDSLGGTDSTIGVYTADCAMPTELACGEDECTTGASPFLSQSSVVGLTVGDQYIIRVMDWTPAAGGDYTLNLSPLSDCPCTEAQAASEPASNSCSGPDFGDVDLDGDSMPDARAELASFTDLNGGCNNAPGTVQFDTTTFASFPASACGIMYNSYVDLNGDGIADDTDGDGAPNAFRDTDWYIYTHTGPTVRLRWEVTGNGYVAQALVATIAAPDEASCGTISVVDGIFAPSSCEPGIIDFDAVDGETYILFASEGDGSFVDCSADYTASFFVAPPPATGACCFKDESCIDGVTEEECVTGMNGSMTQGVWTEDALCADITCCPDPGCTLTENFGSGEAPQDGSASDLNAGCGGGDPIAAILDQIFDGASTCGKASTYVPSTGGNARDVDVYVYQAVAPGGEQIQWEVTAQFDFLAQLIAIDGPDAFNLDCATAVVLDSPGATLCGDTATLTASVPQNQFVLLLITPTVFEGLPQSPIADVFNYSGTFSVLGPAVTEACCFFDGTCQDLTVAECASLEGESQGPGTDCSTVTCPVLTEACCFQDGSCQDLFVDDCLMMGGFPQANGNAGLTSCADTDCCPDACEAGKTPEGEPVCMDGDDDNFNGGCNSTPNVFGSIMVDEEVCGVTATYDTDIDGDMVPDRLRDTDWYNFTWPGGDAQVRVTSQVPVDVFILDASDCANVTVIASGGTTDCAEAAIDAPALPAGNYTLFVGFNFDLLSNDFQVPCSGQFNYNVVVSTPAPACDNGGDCPDVDRSGVVDVLDLNRVLGAFNAAEGDPNYDVNADIDCSGVVDVLDLNLVLGAFNAPAPSPACDGL